MDQIGKNVVQGIDEKELNEFTSNVLGDMSTIQNLCGGMLNGAVGASQGGGINQAMQMMQMMQGGSDADVQKMMNTMMQQPKKKE